MYNSVSSRCTVIGPTLIRSCTQVDTQRTGVAGARACQYHELMMAAALITVLPALILFLALQRYYLARQPGQ